jgi:hypothetical protein
MFAAGDYMQNGENSEDCLRQLWHNAALPKTWGSFGKTSVENGTTIITAEKQKYSKKHIEKALADNNQEVTP